MWYKTCGTPGRIIGHLACCPWGFRVFQQSDPFTQLTQSEVIKPWLASRLSYTTHASPPFLHSHLEATFLLPWLTWLASGIAFTQGCWAAAEDGFEGSLPLPMGIQVSLPSPRWRGWMTWQHRINCVDQKFYVMGLGLPDLSPWDLVLHCLFPSRPGALLRHFHCPASLLFFNPCLHLLQDEQPPVLPVCLLIVRCSVST